METSTSYNSNAYLSADSRPSGETAKLHLQRGVFKRLQQIQISKVPPAIYRVQPARNAAAPPQESAHEDPLHLLLEEGLRVRYQQTQLTNFRRRNCYLPAPAAQTPASAPEFYQGPLSRHPPPPRQAQQAKELPWHVENQSYYVLAAHLRFNASRVPLPAVDGYCEWTEYQSTIAVLLQ